MAEELEPYLAKASTITEQLEIGSARFSTAKIEGKRVLLVQSGIGLVNAAVASTIAVVQFGATSLISAGSAGGIGAGVRVGDVVIGNQARFSTADATAFTHYEHGQIPQMPAVYESCLETTPSWFNGFNSQVHAGEVISSDAFVWEKNFADITQKFPAALAADMETAAIAQVAYKFGVKWLAVRGISDLCGPNDFNEHLDTAAALSADVTMRLVGFSG
jgi:adenosylhomocysteine nucleosidase